MLTTLLLYISFPSLHDRDVMMPIDCSPEFHPITSSRCYSLRKQLEAIG